MFEDLSWLKGLSVPALICGTLIVLAGIEFYSRFVMEDGSIFTNLIRALRGPRQIITTTTNICPQCQKIKTRTQVINPEE